MNATVFVSYSTDDRAAADFIHDLLEAAGIGCWVAQRDLTPGVIWSERIVDAIHESRVMILLLSRHSNASQYVIREITAAVEQGLPILTVRIEDVLPSKALKLFVSSEQWLDAFTLRPAEYKRQLLDVVRTLLAEAPAAATVTDTTPAGAASSTLFVKHRTAVRAALALLAVGALSTLGMVAKPWLNGREAVSTATLRITTASPQPVVGDTFEVQLEALGEQSPVRWRSSDSTVVSSIVSDQARFVARSEGSVLLYAETDRGRDSVRADVLPPPLAALSIAAPTSLRVGDTRALSVAAKDRAGRELRSAAVVWRSETPHVVSIDAQRGIATGVSAGRGRITARVDSISATAVIVVLAPRVALPAQQPTDTPSPQREPQPPQREPVLQPRDTAVQRILPVTAAELRSFADLCLTALRGRDHQWLQANYAPRNAADVDNLRSLNELFARPQYQLLRHEILTADFAGAAIDFLAEFTYRRFAGGAATERGTFRVTATAASGHWRMASCRLQDRLSR